MNREAISPELRDLLALHLVPGLGPRLTAALLERFGSARAILQTREDELSQVPHIGQNLASRLRQAMDHGDVEKEIERMQKHGVGLLRRGVPPYPALLATIPTPPELLYFRGQLHERDRQAVALVGSRSCSSYGKRVAERLAGDLARAGFTVVSGLARGIDGAAHRGALDAGGRTIAVLAGGLAKIYPPEHAELAQQVEVSGALISEAAMQMEPMAVMFPARNRIISGLCRAVVVVEAAEKSGALITVTHALEQGREVFAVPGPVDSPTSAGALALLRKGARLIRNANDIIADLEGIAPLLSEEDTSPLLTAVHEPPPGLDDTQRGIWDFLAEARHMDQMAQHLGLSIPELVRNLMTLEMKKAVKRLPGNQYERC
jgi:DNA processing protein